MIAPTHQLSLALSLDDHATFESFEPGDNADLIDHLQGIACAGGRASTYLWGLAGSGRTHLLVSLCRKATACGRTAGYLSLADAEACGGDLSAIDGIDVLCLDDIDAIVGDSDTQAAVFALFNRMFDRPGVVVVAGSAAPAALGLELPDLTSRLGAGPVYRIASLDDAARARALRRRATQRGIGLGDEVVRYILRRYPRDMAALITLLDQLDRLSLTRKRRVTVALVRELEAL